MRSLSTIDKNKINKIKYLEKNEAIKTAENKNKRNLLKSKSQIRENIPITKIATINMDNLRTKDSFKRLAKLMNKKKIDIGCIQETHNERMDVEEIENYTIYFGGSIVQGESLNNNQNNYNKAGVAIIIKTTLIPLIKNVIRTNGRLMEIRLKTGNLIKSLSIINTYAPHKGYKQETIENYWNTTRAYLSLIPKNLTKIWGTDNNGQIARNEDNKNYVGEWAKSNVMENHNSKMLRNTCDENDMVLRNTLFKPKNGDKTNLATWYNTDGTISKQLDYIAIDEKKVEIG